LSIEDKKNFNSEEAKTVKRRFLTKAITTQRLILSQSIVKK